MDTIFQALKEVEKPTPLLTHSPRTQWVLAVLLRLIDARTDHLRQPDHSWNVARTLTKVARNLLVVDTGHRAEVAAE